MFTRPHDLDPTGARYNTTLPPEQDIHLAIKQHQERLAKGTTAELIEQVLNED